MSSFTHHLEAEILNQHIKTDGLYLGLSRQAGNRQGDFATWEYDAEEDQYETTDGIDEPGEGWVYDNETESWVEETAPSYDRQSIGATSWYDVEVVLGPDGDSELRLSVDVEFGTLLEEDEDWGNISHFFLVDSVTTGEGNILAWGSMPDSMRIVEDMEAKIWANTIVVRMTD